MNITYGRTMCTGTISGYCVENSRYFWQYMNILEICQHLWIFCPPIGEHYKHNGKGPTQRLCCVLGNQTFLDRFLAKMMVMMVEAMIIIMIMMIYIYNGGVPVSCLSQKWLFSSGHQLDCWWWRYIYNGGVCARAQPSVSPPTTLPLGDATNWKLIMIIMNVDCDNVDDWQWNADIFWISFPIVAVGLFFTKSLFLLELSAAGAKRGVRSLPARTLPSRRST